MDKSRPGEIQIDYELLVLSDHNNRLKQKPTRLKYILNLQSKFFKYGTNA